MLNEWEEFSAYTRFPEYKADYKDDTGYMGRFTFPMLLEFEGFGRVLTILARGYLFREGSDGYDRIDFARRALLAWCSLSGEKTKKAPDQENDPRLRVNYGEYAKEFPELVTPDGDGWLIRHVDNIVAFIEAMAIALANLKVKVLFKIILSTYSLEVLFGLLVTIVCFSLVFMTVEPQAADPSATNIIRTFPDALWYCFAVVTTIGFGDLTAITPIGRILTVILGMYGLVVVAVITSIVVNFYNETSGKHDQKELKENQKEEENNK